MIMTCLVPITVALMQSDSQTSTYMYAKQTLKQAQVQISHRSGPDQTGVPRRQVGAVHRTLMELDQTVPQGEQ